MAADNAVMIFIGIISLVFAYLSVEFFRFALIKDNDKKQWVWAMAGILMLGTSFYLIYGGFSIGYSSIDAVGETDLLHSWSTVYQAFEYFIRAATFIGFLVFILFLVHLLKGLPEFFSGKSKENK